MITSTEKLNSLQGKFSQPALSAEWRPVIETPKFSKTLRTKWLIIFPLSSKVNKVIFGAASLMQDHAISNAKLRDAEESQ